MTIQSNTLRPGLLVSLKTSIAGNVRYAQAVIEAEHKTEAGEAKARWETERTIVDPVEHEAAKVARSKASALIRGVCATSAFGLLCPENAAPDLEKAIAEARALADTFNEGAKLSRISVYVITGRIAPDDVEAVKAINSEISELLAEMATGVQNLDVKAVRDAASRAKRIGSMLSPDSEARVRIAIDTAREAAKKIVKAGEQASQEIDATAVRKITEMRTAFLDLDDAKEIAAPTASARALDLAPTAQSEIGYAPARAAVEV